MRLGLVGAGQIGGTLAHLGCLSHVEEVVLIDALEGVAQGKALDLAQAFVLRESHTQLRGSQDYEDLVGCDVVVVTAGFPRKPGMDRDDLLKKNGEVLWQVGEAIRRSCPEAFVIVVTNPLDAMAWTLYHALGAPSRRVVGMAGILDTARFRLFLSQSLGVSARDIQALVLGGHGDDMVPLLSHVTVSGVPLDTFIERSGRTIDLDAVVKRTRYGGGEIVSLLKNGSAFYAPAMCAFEMIDAFRYDEKRVLPCSTWLDGAYGLRDIFAGVPVIVKLYEYQAKKILSGQGIPTPRGILITSPGEASDAARTIGGGAWMLKAQIKAGGRGKAGGIRLVRGADTLEKEARDLLGQRLVTHQTGPEGLLVESVYVEQAISIQGELYLGCIFDRAHACIRMIFSHEGGVDIEDVKAITTCAIDPVIGFQPFHGRLLSEDLPLSPARRRNLLTLMEKLYAAVMACDALLIELNPLTWTADDQLVALDARMILDDNAWALRHEEVLAELLGSESSIPSFNYIPLDGEIGCLVNGAGLAMATMDLIHFHGGRPANFLDIGGGASRESVAEALRLLYKKTPPLALLINIFGGIVQCDQVAQGLLDALDLYGDLPVVVRLDGTNVDKGKQLLEKSPFTIIIESNFNQAVLRTLSLAQEGNEGIPVLEMLKIKRLLIDSKTKLIGPNCPGLIRPGNCKIGIMPGHLHSPGSIGIVSRSGTLTYEAVAQTTNLGLGQSLCIGIGGDPVHGVSFVDCIKFFFDHEGTDAIVMIGEIGGAEEEETVDFLTSHEFKKPIIAYIAGVTAPPGQKMGHAGAIISKKQDNAAPKIEVLEQAGVIIAHSPAHIGQTVYDVLHPPEKKT
eukprot:g8348.t1